MKSDFVIRNARLLADFWAAVARGGTVSGAEHALLQYLERLFDNYVAFAILAALAPSKPGELNPRYRELLQVVKERLLTAEFGRLSRTVPATRLEALRGRVSLLLDAKLAGAIAGAHLAVRDVAVAPTAKKRSQRVHRPNRLPDVVVSRISVRVRRLKKDRLTQKEICNRLGNSERPSNVRWRDLSWPKAYAHSRYHQSVKTWLSGC